MNSKDISRAEHEYMHIHPLINALVTNEVTNLHHRAVGEFSAYNIRSCC